MQLRRKAATQALSCRRRAHLGHCRGCASWSSRPRQGSIYVKLRLCHAPYSEVHCPTVCAVPCPQNQYTKLSKLVFAIEKLLLVTSELPAAPHHAELPPRPVLSSLLGVNEAPPRVKAPGTVPVHIGAVTAGTAYQLLTYMFRMRTRWCLSCICWVAHTAQALTLLL